jgi:hypothetical protein
MGIMLVYMLLYGQIYYSEEVVQNPPSLHLFVRTWEDRKKGEPRKVTHRNTNVSSDTVSAIL